MSNWKTTILGVCTILGAIAAAGVALLDGDPDTVFNYTTLAAGVTAGIGLITAADGAKDDK